MCNRSEWYKVKIKGQAYSQAKLIEVLGAILDDDVPKRQSGWKPKFPEIEMMKYLVRKCWHWAEIWILHIEPLCSKPFTPMNDRNSENSSLCYVCPKIFITHVLDLPLERKHAWESWKGSTEHCENCTMSISKLYPKWISVTTYTSHLSYLKFWKKSTEQGIIWVLRILRSGR